MRVPQNRGSVANTGAPQGGGLIDLLKGGDARGRNTAGGIFDLIDRNAPIESGFGGNAAARLTNLSASDAKHGFKDRGDDFAGLGEWLVYNQVVRRNKKLSNAQKAKQARDWAHNFKVKGYGFYEQAALDDAEKYEAAAERDRKLERERQREKEKEKEQESEEESENEEPCCSSCQKGPLV